MRCSYCGQVIPKERLEILPHTQTCVNCSDEKRVVGAMVWDKKTPIMEIRSNLDDFQRYERLDGRLGRLK